MDGGDDRSFTIDFSSDGVVKLRVAVKEKLKEFLGDYTDDTLVEYVIVLLKNGRRKVEAKNELDVFLGDDSDSFITWLWDHLGSSLHVYSQSLSIQSDEVGSVKPAVHEPVGKNDSHKTESEEGRSKKLPKTRHRRQWNGLVGDVEDSQILKCSITESDPLKEDDTHIKVHSVKPCDSLHNGAQRKRIRSEACGFNKILSTSIARGSNKKEELQQAVISAPRRLLQFAVRDAVATSNQSISIRKPSLKRLRSLVSAASVDTTLDDRLDSRRPVTRVSNNMITVIKAVAEAAEDVKRVGPLHNVFDRPSHETCMFDVSEQLRDFGEDFSGDRYVRPYNEMNRHSSYHSDLKEQYVSDTTLLPRDTEMTPESGFEYELYNSMEISGRGSKDVFMSSEVARNEVEDSLMFPYDADFSGDLDVRPDNKVNFHSSYYNEFQEHYVSDTTLLLRDAELTPESGFEYDLYNDMDFGGRGSKDISMSSEVVRKRVEDSLMFPCDVDFSEDRYVRPHNKMNDYSDYHSDFKEQYVSDTTLLPRDNEITPEPGLEYGLYNDMEFRGRGLKGVSMSSEVVRKKVEDSLMFQYGAANNADGRSQKAISSVSVPYASHNMVTWRSPQYRDSRENMKFSRSKSKVENNALAVKLNELSAEANKDCAMVGKGNVKSEAGIDKDFHKTQLLTHGPHSTGPPTDDSDSRTIFVSNVHFAAAKDSLSRNFNKFGEVLKVIILSDPATRLPKGSAYVEFMRKEAAEHALSLDGTSFMSRILKVVKKCAAPLEASSSSGWPRAARSFPCPSSGFSTTPFPRGNPNVYRAHSLKPGARSFQWKRDMQSIPTQMSNQASKNSLPASPRGLTYVRAVPKTSGMSSKA